MKKCSSCGQVLDENMFHKNSAMKDGKQGWCKVCKAEYMKHYRVKPKKETNPVKQEPIKIKRCTKCGRVLPVTSFYKKRLSKDGLQSWCKNCQDEYSFRAAKARASIKKEKITEREKWYTVNNTGLFSFGIPKLIRKFINPEKEVKIPHDKLISLVINKGDITIRYMK